MSPDERTDQAAYARYLQAQSAADAYASRYDYGSESVTVYRAFLAGVRWARENPAPCPTCAETQQVLDTAGGRKPE